MAAKSEVRRRRRHTEEFKQSVVSACRAPGVSVSGVALANGVNANLLHRWLRERGVEPASRRLPSTVQLPGRPAAPTFIPIPVAPMVGEAPSADIRIEVQRGNAVIKVSWPVSAAGDCAAWLKELLR